MPNGIFYCEDSGKRKRARKALGLYLEKENTQEIKNRNKKIKRKALAIIKVMNSSPNDNFTLFLQDLIDKKKGVLKTKNAYQLCYNYLHKFAEKPVKWYQIDLLFIDNFRDYLLRMAKTEQRKPLERNTAKLIYSCFVHALNQAVRYDHLEYKIIQQARMIKAKEVKREYLTLEEIRLLVKTPCKKDYIKNAFLFSCFTGLRASDVQNLIWKDVLIDDEGNYSINYRQTKTKKIENLPINEQILGFMGDMPMNDDSKKVFKFKYNSHINPYLRQWCKDAGITKNITFHCARHTFAMLKLSVDKIDIYTVSKLLGHGTVTTTEIYAKMTNEIKMSAMGGGYIV